MKHRPLGRRACALLVLVLSATGLIALTVWNCRESPAGRGETLPQQTGPPGFQAKGVNVWGMPNYDLFTPVNSPVYVDVAAGDTFLFPADGVCVIDGKSASYVFPEVIMASYHVVNDVLDGEPIAVTFCLLAGSSCRFSRRLNDRVLTFGLTGQLYAGNSVLYDMETKTDWLQLNGEPIQGHYFGRARLNPRTLERTTWQRAKRKSNVKVLAPLRPMAEYRNFYEEIEAERLGRRVVQSQIELDQRLVPYAAGIGVRIQGDARFYPEDSRAQRAVRNDVVGGWALLVLREGDGATTRVFRRWVSGRQLDFDLADGHLRDLQTASVWDDEGVCVSGALKGHRLEVPFYSRVYWFVWSALHPETTVP